MVRDGVFADIIEMDVDLVTEVAVRELDIVADFDIDGVLVFE